MDPQSRVKASVRLGSETYTLYGSKNTGSLSEQLVTMKEDCMKILKEYITKNNALADVPDEPLEGSSGDDEDISNKPIPKKRK